MKVESAENEGKKIIAQKESHRRKAILYEKGYFYIVEVYEKDTGDMWFRKFFFFPEAKDFFDNLDGFEIKW